MPLFPTQIFNAASVPSIQEMLVTLSEYVSGTITTSEIEDQKFILGAIQQTLINSVNIINAYQMQSFMAQEDSVLTRISSVLTHLSVQDQTLINNRLASVNDFIQTVYPLNTALLFDVNQLNTGNVALQGYDLTSYLVQFNFETPPVNLTLNNLIAQAQLMSNAWFNALNYIGTQGSSFQLTAYSSVERMYYSSQDTANFVDNLNLSLSLTDLTQIWNSLIALPSILRVFDLLFNDPSTQLSQSLNALKFTIYNLIYITNSLLSSFNVPNNLQQPITSTLRSGESLLDFAARTTGDYSQWQDIAKANGLSPPYTSAIPMLGLASPGQKLYLPPFTFSGPISNYNDDYLGTDLEIGFPYSTMTTWSGDFALVRGVSNYIEALARRVLTPVGSLIYHTTYGSLLPLEVGAISTASEAKLLASYLKSALLSDTRTQAVNKITAYPVAFGQIVMTSIVTPYGSASAEPFNLVIIPQGSLINR